jgi:DNA polymerase type B, organellar and viral
LKIHKVYSYEKKEKIFDKYVDYFYEKKINSDNEIEKLIYKLLLNSLYGKFGSTLNYCNLLKVDDTDLSLYELTHVVLNKLGHS